MSCVLHCYGCCKTWSRQLTTTDEDEQHANLSVRGSIQPVPSTTISAATGYQGFAH